MYICFVPPIFSGYCLWNLVCSIIMAPVRSALVPANRSRLLKIVVTPRTTTRGRFRPPPFPSLSSSKIYLPRKSTGGGTLNSIPSSEEKKTREKVRTKTLVSFVLRFAGILQYVFRPYKSVGRFFVSLLTYREYCDSIAVQS